MSAWPSWPNLPSEGRRSVTVETGCDKNLYIWHVLIGCQGSHNDINVLRQSPLLHDVMSGAWPPDRFEYVLSGRSRRLLYYLADGTYPQYLIFVRPFPNAITPQQRMINRLQKALRKDMERVFAVLMNRFHMALYPARFSSVTRMIATGRAIAISHNMVIRERRDGFL